MPDIEICPIFFNRRKDSVTYINGHITPFDANSPSIASVFLNVREKRTLRLIIATLPVTDIELWINLKDLFLKHLDLKQNTREYFLHLYSLLSSYFNKHNSL